MNGTKKYTEAVGKINSNTNVLNKKFYYFSVGERSAQGESSLKKDVD